MLRTLRAAGSLAGRNRLARDTQLVAHGTDGSIVRGPATVFDVRHTLPPPRAFWQVYSAGTFQNFPVSARHHLTTAGTYVFHLAELDTETLPNGAYALTVRATDICGNTGTLRTTIQVANRPNS